MAANTDTKQTVYTALSGDSGVTALVGTNIYYNYLPDRHPVAQDAITLVVRTDSTVRDMCDTILYKQKNVNIRIYSQDQENLYTILDAVESVVDELDYADLESDDEPFYDEQIGWFVMDMNFQMNEF